MFILYVNASQLKAHNYIFHNQFFFCFHLIESFIQIEATTLSNHDLHLSISVSYQWLIYF